MFPNLPNRISCERSRTTAISTYLKVCKTIFYYIPARVDKAGHEHCWGCKEYYDELKVIDGYIQGIMKALNETKTSQGIELL